MKLEHEIFENIIMEAREYGASDIHLLRDMPPMFRHAGAIGPSKNWRVLDKSFLQDLAEALLEPAQRERLKREREICISYFSERCGRHRLTFYHRMGTIEIAVRLAQTEILSRKNLGLSATIDEVLNNTAGLILVTGPTGSGKTTTLNYMIDIINQSRNGKIITIEDPLEFEHSHKCCLVTQIEVGTDTLTFPSFLRSALRLDPDVLVIGEMRDEETTATALTSAETGHLVLATLHTSSAVSTAERIVNAFPGEKQPQIASQVAATLLAVFSQRLIPTIDKQKRVLASELMLGNLAVRNLIRERNYHKLPSVIETSRQLGMHSMESSLAELYRNKIITRTNAFAYANNQAHLESILKKHTAT